VSAHFLTFEDLSMRNFKHMTPCLSQAQLGARVSSSCLANPNPNPNHNLTLVVSDLTLFYNPSPNPNT